MGSDGGPAFPFSTTTKSMNGDDVTSAYAGMTLRDWFAGQAMAAIMTRYYKLWDEGTETSDDDMAKEAYSSADAMLAARKVDPS